MGLGGFLEVIYLIFMAITLGLLQLLEYQDSLI